MSSPPSRRPLRTVFGSTPASSEIVVVGEPPVPESPSSESATTAASTPKKHRSLAPKSSQWPVLLQQQQQQGGLFSIESTDGVIIAETNGDAGGSEGSAGDNSSVYSSTGERTRGFGLRRSSPGSSTANNESSDGVEARVVQAAVVGSSLRAQTLQHNASQQRPLTATDIRSPQRHISAISTSVSSTPVRDIETALANQSPGASAIRTRRQQQQEKLVLSTHQPHLKVERVRSEAGQTPRVSFEETLSSGAISSMPANLSASADTAASPSGISKTRKRRLREMLPPSAAALLDTFSAIDTVIALLKKRGKTGLGPSLLASAALPRSQVVITPSNSKTNFITIKCLQDEMAAASSRSFGPDILKQLLGIAPGSFHVLCARIGSNGEACDGSAGVRLRAEELPELSTTINQSQSKRRNGTWQHVIDINPFWLGNSIPDGPGSRREAFEDLLYESLDKPNTTLPQAVLPSLIEIALDDTKKVSQDHLDVMTKDNPPQVPLNVAPEITQEDVQAAIKSDPDLKGLSFTTIARMLEKERAKETAKLKSGMAPFSTTESRTFQRDLHLLPQVFDAIHDALHFPPPKRQVEYMRILSDKVCRTLGEKGCAISQAEFRSSAQRLFSTQSLAMDYCEIKTLPAAVIPSMNRQTATNAPSSLAFSSGRSSSTAVEAEKDREVLRLSQDAWSGRLTKKVISDRITEFVKASASTR